MDVLSNVENTEIIQSENECSMNCSIGKIELENTTIKNQSNDSQSVSE